MIVSISYERFLGAGYSLNGVEFRSIENIYTTPKEWDSLKFKWEVELETYYKDLTGQAWSVIVTAVSVLTP